MKLVPQGGSKWALPIIVLRKLNGDLRIYGDYKVGVNYKSCSNSYPIPNIENIFVNRNKMIYEN